MSVIASQSIKNAIITYIGFAIGAANTLFLYTHILGDTYYGLVGFILSSANLLMPLIAFGVQNSLIKYFPTYTTEESKTQFLSFVLLLPLLFIVPLTVIGAFFYYDIAQLISYKNPIIYDYAWIVPLVGFSMAYFEIFYAWVKAHYQSVFGSFIKEVVVRAMVAVTLLLVYFELLSPVDFIYALVLIYGISMVLMMVYAFRIRRPSFSLVIPKEAKQIIEYSAFIILSGSVAMVMLDLDKFMLAQYISIENIAYYSVAIFICIVIYVPSRAMHQILHPVTSKLMADNDYDKLDVLYKKSSISLQVAGGLVFLGILLNIKQLYLLIPEQYSGGISIVFMVGFSKYFELLLGNNNSIIYNSTYYKLVLFLGVGLALLSVAFNMLLIPYLGLNGAALATLLAATIYSWSKWLFVVKKMKLFPFTIKTVYALILLFAFIGVFYFWDFSFHPIINIALKTLLFAPLYIYIHYTLQIAPEVNRYVDILLQYVIKKRN